MDYSDPHYLLPQPATSVLSETRLTHLSASALRLLNFILDEVLLTTLSASLSHHSPSPPTSPSTPAILTGPLGADEVLTTDKFKQGLVRTVGPLLGKNAALEAELAIRELLRMGAPSLRGDPALRKASFAGSLPGANGRGSDGDQDGSIQIDGVFRSLRAWVQAVSGLGALYAERCLTYLADYILRAVGRVAERSASTETAGVIELEAAINEDDSLWSWYKTMKIRFAVEAEVAREKARLTPGSASAPQMGPGGATSPVTRRGSIKNKESASSFSRNSIDSASFSGSGSVAGYSTGLGISNENTSDGFDLLIQSGKTMKVSLTPDRLRTMEKFERSRPKSVLVAPSVPEIVVPPPTRTRTRRLKARGPHQRQIDEEEDDDDDSSSNSGGGYRRPKETMLDLLNSPPPPTWNEADPLTKQRSPTSGSDTYSPTAPPMVAQHSHDSALSSDSNVSDTSEGVAEWANMDPDARRRTLKPKNEKKDLLQERQVNTDLADFFANSPPPPEPRSDTGSFFSATPSTPPMQGSPSRKKGISRFLGLAKKSKDEESEPKLPRSSSTTSVNRPSSISSATRRAYGVVSGTSSAQPPLSEISYSAPSASSSSPSRRSSTHQPSSSHATAETSVPPVPTVPSQQRNGLRSSETDSRRPSNVNPLLAEQIARSAAANGQPSPTRSTSPLPPPIAAPSPTSTDPNQPLRNKTSSRSVASSVPSSSDTISPPRVLAQSSSAEALRRASLTKEMPIVIGAGGPPSHGSTPTISKRNSIASIRRIPVPTVNEAAGAAAVAGVAAAAGAAAVTANGQAGEGRRGSVEKSPVVDEKRRRSTDKVSLVSESRRPSIEEVMLLRRHSVDKDLPKSPTQPSTELSAGVPPVTTNGTTKTVQVVPPPASEAEELSIDAILRDLKAQMQSATSAEDCIKIVDRMLSSHRRDDSGFAGSPTKAESEQAKEVVIVEATSAEVTGKPEDDEVQKEVEEEKGDDLEDAIQKADREQAAYEERSMASLVEFFLGDKSRDVEEVKEGSGTTEPVKENGVKDVEQDAEGTVADEPQSVATKSVEVTVDDKAGEGEEPIKTEDSAEVVEDLATPSLVLDKAAIVIPEAEGAAPSSNEVGVGSKSESESTEEKEE
ncbi:hypothetical protein MNV49_005813 [Pseudohyphozyma bogoriensis]|nr:hypothetical protein MNV49_005813 [Pseudohyphozyma bogoriensis]